MSHFSFGSGGGVPAIGCGRGRVTLPIRFVDFADRRGTVQQQRIGDKRRESEKINFNFIIAFVTLRYTATTLLT